jgi:hypothetical protein
MTKQLLAITVAMIAAVTSLVCSAEAEERFQKLTGAQIRAKFTGMQFTDEVHWAEKYEPNGKLSTEEMGAKCDGAWRVQNDKLCTNYVKDGADNCFEVWMSGRKIEMRTPGSENSSLEGVLEKPSSRR